MATVVNGRVLIRGGELTAAAPANSFVPVVIARLYNKVEHLLDILTGVSSSR